MARSKATRAVAAQKAEMKILQKTGMLEIAKRRTRNILRQHVAGNSRIETIACDCYLQGLRDATQVIYGMGQDSDA